MSKIQKTAGLKTCNDIFASVTICISTALLCGGAFGAIPSTADAYKMDMETSFEISASCAINGGTQTSQIDLVIDSTSAATDPKVLSNASAHIRVCSPFTDPVNETLPIPIPVALMMQSAKLSLGKTISFPVNSPQLAAMFTDGSAPNTLQVQKTDANRFELRYVHSATGDTKIGPIRATLTAASSLTAVPGFNAAQSLPIQHIEVDVPEKNVTLRADIAKVKMAARIPASLQ